jgi:hypothetical protein
MFTSSEYFDMLVLYGQCDELMRVLQLLLKSTQFDFPIGEHPSRNLKNTIT